MKVHVYDTHWLSGWNKTCKFLGEFNSVEEAKANETIKHYIECGRNLSFFQLIEEVNI